MKRPSLRINDVKRIVGVMCVCASTLGINPLFAQDQAQVNATLNSAQVNSVETNQVSEPEKARQAAMIRALQEVQTNKIENPQNNTTIPESKNEDAIPQEISQAEQNSKVPQTWLEKGAERPYIALVNEYETTLKPDWSYEETYHARVKIQKEEGKNLGQWPIYYNNSRDAITDIQARVETSDGHQYPATNIQDVQVYDDSPMYWDIMTKVVSLPQVKVGSIIDVTVKSTTTAKEIPNQFWAEILYPAIATQRASHAFIFPDDKPIGLKSYKNNNKPTIEKSNGRIKYTFMFNETQSLPDQEEFMPPLQEVLGGLYFSSISDWKTVADWYRNLVRKNIVDDPEITVKTLELVKDKTTQKDKAHAILEFLQDNFRYVSLNFGDNTVYPHPTNEVFKNRYADSKDLASLTKQMFKLAGIESNICFLSEEFSGNPQLSLPEPSVFSHVILQANFDGQYYFIDPRLKGYDFGQYPSNFDNAYVMIIDDVGFKFDNLPVGSEETHTLISQGDITIAPNGAAEFRVHVKLPLETSQNFRQSWRTSSNEDKDKFFVELEKNFSKGGRIIDRKVVGVENRYGFVEFDLKYESPDAYPLINDMILIKEEDQSDMPDFSDKQRQYPVFVPNNSVIKNSNTYHVPEGFKINFVPSNYSLSGDLMEMTTNYSQKDNLIEIDSTYRIKRCSVPVERYPQLRDFRMELSKKTDQYIILKKSSDISPEAKDWVKKQ